MEDNENSDEDNIITTGVDFPIERLQEEQVQGFVIDNDNFSSDDDDDDDDNEDEEEEEELDKNIRNDHSISAESTRVEKKRGRKTGNKRKRSKIDRKGGSKKKKQKFEKTNLIGVNSDRKSVV